MIRSRLMFPTLLFATGLLAACAGTPEDAVAVAQASGELSSENAARVTALNAAASGSAEDQRRLALAEATRNLSPDDAARVSAAAAVLSSPNADELARQQALAELNRRLGSDDAARLNAASTAAAALLAGDTSQLAQQAKDAAAMEAANRASAATEAAAEKALGSTLNRFGVFGGIASAALTDSVGEAVKGGLAPPSDKPAADVTVASAEAMPDAVDITQTAPGAYVDTADGRVYKDPAVIGETADGRVLRRVAVGKPTGPVGIECLWTTETATRGFVPVDVRVTPLSPMDELNVKIEPDDGVILRDGPVSRALKTTVDQRWLRRVYALRAGDRDSYLRITATARRGSEERIRVVLCPLDEVPATPPLPSSLLKPAPGGEAVISMPAQ